MNFIRFNFNTFRVKWPDLHLMNGFFCFFYSSFSIIFSLQKIFTLHLSQAKHRSKQTLNQQRYRKNHFEEAKRKKEFILNICTIRHECLYSSNFFILFLFRTFFVSFLISRNVDHFAVVFISYARSIAFV